jgi:hypothetical protein
MPEKSITLLLHGDAVYFGFSGKKEEILPRTTLTATNRNLLTHILSDTMRVNFLTGVFSAIGFQVRHHALP